MVGNVFLLPPFLPKFSTCCMIFPCLPLFLCTCSLFYTCVVHVLYVFYVYIYSYLFPIVPLLFPYLFPYCSFLFPYCFPVIISMQPYTCIARLSCQIYYLESYHMISKTDRNVRKLPIPFEKRYKFERVGRM